MKIERYSAETLAALRAIGSATISATLSTMGIRNSHIEGPVSLNPGRTIAGTALTLQFMPRREDVFPQAEYDDPETQLHRHVLYDAGPGDIVVVDARGDMSSGVFGEMMLTYLAGRGGSGVVIDGCIRDTEKSRSLGLGLWVRGSTPNYHMQTNIAPFAFNVPIACANVLVFPGDAIVADDDGAVAIPKKLVEAVIRESNVHSEWEIFSREKLAQGADLRLYYPLHDSVLEEYEQWKKANGAG